MKPYNEQEFNRLCAEFLGINLDLNSNQINKYYQQAISMYEFERIDGTNKDFIDYFLFHSDWNWIMEIRDKIISLGYRVEIGTTVIIGLKLPDIKNDFKQFADLYTDEILGNSLKIVSNNNNEKEAVVQAIWEFLNWYNEQKL